MTENSLTRNTGACPEFEPLLEDRLSGELGGGDAALVAEHLKSCAGCNAALDHVALSSRLLSLVEPAADPGPGFAHRTMARIRHAEALSADERSIWKPFVSLAWRFAVTTAVALALVITVDVGTHRDNSYVASNSASSEDAGLFPDTQSSPVERDDFLVPAGDVTHGSH